MTGKNQKRLSLARFAYVCFLIYSNAYQYKHKERKYMAPDDQNPAPVDPAPVGDDAGVAPVDPAPVGGDDAGVPPAEEAPAVDEPVEPAA